MHQLKWEKLRHDSLMAIQVEETRTYQFQIHNICASTWMLLHVDERTNYSAPYLLLYAKGDSRISWSRVWIRCFAEFLPIG